MSAGMGPLRVSSNSGIQVEYRGKRYALDPKSPPRSDFVFVSHAHVDHIHNPSSEERIIMSEETAQLAKARGYDLGLPTQNVDGVELLDSGHVLGSRAIRIDDELFYTGDASGRERGFLGKCKTKPARVLVMETTYGSPEYVFPQTAKLVKEVNTLIAEIYDKGRPVVLMGYPLGKAQLLGYFFSSWGPLYYHVAVAKMNEIHRSHGVPLREGRPFDPKADLNSLPKGPWTMISPMSSSRSKTMSHLKKKYGAVLVAFSGWALGQGYRYSLGADYAFPLSDHCDYPELVKLVENVSPELVYTTHGFEREFAGDLRRMGFGARTLTPHQSSLFDYVQE